MNFVGGNSLQSFSNKKLFLADYNEVLWKEALPMDNCNLHTTAPLHQTPILRLLLPIKHQRLLSLTPPKTIIRHPRQLSLNISRYSESLFSIRIVFLSASTCKQRIQ